MNKGTALIALLSATLIDPCDSISGAFAVPRVI